VSTAVEMQLRQEQAARWLDSARDTVWREMVTPLTVIAFGRTVHRQRARKLRQRGHLVVRLRTGVYRWCPAPFKLTVPDDSAQPVNPNACARGCVPASCDITSEQPAAVVPAAGR